MDKQAQHNIVIDACHSPSKYIANILRYRELLIFLTWRNLIVRYKQTFFGILWAILKPLLTILVLTLVFNKVAKLPAYGVEPYILMVFAGVLPWQFFATSVQNSGDSIVSNVALVSKIFFPRVLIPVSTIFTAAVDFFIALCFCALMMIFYKAAPGWQIIFLPLFVIQTMLLAAGLGFFIAALNVTYRDFKHLVPFCLQLGLYISPVGFSSRIVPENLQLLYALNPMVGIIDGFRWCMLADYQNIPYIPGILMSLAMTAIILWIGSSTFKKMENSFADII